MKKYNSKYFDYPIEIENIDGELIVSIKTREGKNVIYSIYDLVEKTSYSPYIKNAILSCFINKIPKKILIIGFGAGAFAKYFKDYLGSKVSISGIEIDETMIEIARQELNLYDINYFNLDYIDALNILNKKKNSKFDIIFFDVYDNNGKIPDNFNNLEIINLIRNLLSDNGIFIVNYANYDSNTDFFDDIEEKIISIFGKKYIKISNGKNDNGNIVGVYNLNEVLNSEKLILRYLEKVQNGEINYDNNLIKNIFLK